LFRRRGLSIETFERIAAPQRTREALAAFYTPKTLADRLAKWAIRNPSDTVLEPSFGGCEVLASIHERLLDLGAIQPWRQIFGCDVSAFAHGVLAKRLKPEQRGNFRTADFLALEPARDLPRVSAVLANPPYIGHHCLAGVRRTAIAKASKSYPFALGGQSNLWAHFLAHSLSFVVPKGRLAFILPLSYRHAEFAKPIRDYLAASFAKVITVECVERLFSHEATQERVVLVLADGFGEAPVESRETRCVTVDELDQKLDARVALRDEAEERRAEANLVLERLYGSHHTRTLGDLASIRIGIVTGDTQYFLGSAAKWRERGVPPGQLKCVVSSSKSLRGLTVSAPELVAQSLKGSRTLALATSSSSRSKGVEKYLGSAAGRVAKQTATAQKRDPWYVLPFQSRPHAIVPSLSHHGPRMTLVGSEVWATNSFYQLNFHADSQEGRKLAAISMQSSFSQLYGELVGQPMSQGGLKFSLEAIRKFRLLLPDDMSAANISATFTTIDRLLRKGEGQTAREQADAMILSFLSPAERALISDFRRRQWERRNACGTLPAASDECTVTRREAVQPPA
jgi:hypothetical protein